MQTENLHFAICILQFAISSAAPVRASTPDEDYGAVAEFSFTERSGRIVERADLSGKVWVAAFVFTRCAGPCAQVSGCMADLQQQLAGYRDLVLVSFTVDPEYDTPQILEQYARRYGADPQRWLFLTGARAEIYRLIRSSFRLGVERNEGQPGYEVEHSTKLVLVDATGHIRGYFDGTDPADLSELKRRIALLLWYHWLPAINASLNGLSAVALSVGYLAIRRRRVRVHKLCMLTALGVSTLFLTSYLYYHIAVQRGEPTPFTATGWVRPVYFAVLISHIFLAALVAPLALFVAYQGLRDRLDRHVRVARWTLPLWLYVSVTGVVVYWMLYHLYPSL